ncbi:unnamed protein product [Brugia timori]|uniref:LAGLIDADG_2 domain-containing protein n=1 Tax=Brugia timori TaxID=42155 RepID=A0A0R3Q550_9BILA|nr:unnamed protein product [Brugia timori]
MNDRRVAAYLRAERELMRRYEEVKYGRFMTSEQGNQIFAPLLTPLREINSKVNSKTKGNSGTTSNVLPKTEKKKKTESRSQKYDINYGIYPKDDRLYVGNTCINLAGDNLLFDSGRKYVVTPGLWALLTEKLPESYTDADLLHYGEIVRDTYSYKLDNDPSSNRIKYVGDKKFKDIIMPILHKYNLIDGKKPIRRGKGLRKVLTSNNVEYVYWNNFDELLERLYILYGEVKAGNTNPTIRNEITSILEEIKER